MNGEQIPRNEPTHQPTAFVVPEIWHNINLFACEVGSSLVAALGIKSLAPTFHIGFKVAVAHRSLELCVPLIL